MSAVTSIKTLPKRTLDNVCANCNTEVMHWVHYAAAGTIGSSWKLFGFSANKHFM